MKANELRLNNYVLEDGQVVLLSTNYDLFKCLVNVNRGIGFEPIPLTEEWLLKFGFERRPWGLIINGLLFRDNIKNPCEVLTLEIGNGFKIEVKYLHQLQNLYFALTAEELTIKNK